MSTQDARYYPILRGRQNELLAIRELAEQDKLRYVVPIIEPIKSSNTLIKTLVEAFGSGATVGIVLNPVLGSFLSDRLRSLLQRHRSQSIGGFRQNPGLLRRLSQRFGTCFP